MKYVNSLKTVKLTEIAKLIRGVTYKKNMALKSPQDDYFPIIRANNIQGELILNDLIYIPKYHINEDQLIKKGDIIIAMSSGSKELVGKAVQAKNDIVAGFGAFCGLIRIISDVNEKYIGFYFQSREYRDHISKLSMGVNINNLRRQHLENLEIPLPPLPTQHRIVEKIEELFSELESGVKSLKKAKEQIGLYKQSVLKAAFAGELVKRETDEVKWDWAKGRGPAFAKASAGEQKAEVLKAAEPGGEYNSLNHDLEGSRITSIKSNESTDKKSRQSHNQDNQGLDILPEGWKWVSVGDVGEIITGTTPSKKKKEYYGNEYPLYKPTDLNAGINTRDASDHLSKIGIKKARLLPENSILVTCIGATIGKTGMNKISGATNQQINAIVPNEYYVPEFIYYYSISDYFQQQIKNKASSTTLPILNKSKFERLLVPNVSLNQQHQIVAEIERRFSEAEHLEKSIDEGLAKAEALRQSILKQAFEGRLVS